MVATNMSMALNTTVCYYPDVGADLSEFILYTPLAVSLVVMVLTWVTHDMLLCTWSLALKLCTFLVTVAQKTVGHAARNPYCPGAFVYQMPSASIFLVWSVGALGLGYTWAWGRPLNVFTALMGGAVVAGVTAAALTLGYATAVSAVVSAGLAVAWNALFLTIMWIAGDYILAEVTAGQLGHWLGFPTDPKRAWVRHAPGEGGGPMSVVLPRPAAMKPVQAK